LLFCGGLTYAFRRLRNLGCVPFPCFFLQLTGATTLFLYELLSAFLSLSEVSPLSEEINRPDVAVFAKSALTLLQRVISFDLSFQSLFSPPWRGFWSSSFLLNPRRFGQ